MLLKNLYTRIIYCMLIIHTTLLGIRPSKQLYAHMFNKNGAHNLIKNLSNASFHTQQPLPPVCSGLFKKTPINFQAPTSSSNTINAHIPLGWPHNMPYIDTKIDLKNVGMRKKFTIEIKDVNPIIGKGGFACDPIPARAIIQEYTGCKRVVPHSLLSTLPYALVLGSVNPKTYAIKYGKPGKLQLIIDAEQCGNETRFFNHSKNPNAKYEMDPHLLGIVFVVASRNIAPGEEITVDYGTGYWENKTIQPL